MNKKSMVIGSILILAGLITGLSTLGFANDGAVLFVLGGAFLAAYIAYKRLLGFLIPGCVLSALGIFVTLDLDKTGEPADGGFAMLLIGLAFLAVFLIHTSRRYEGGWGARYWPLFPAAGTMAIGAALLAVSYKVLDFDLEYLNLINPIILVVIGAAIIISGVRRAGKG